MEKKGFEPLLNNKSVFETDALKPLGHFSTSLLPEGLEPSMLKH